MNTFSIPSTSASRRTTNRAATVRERDAQVFAQAEARGSVALTCFSKFVLLAALFAAPAFGQPMFDSGSNGSDGALDLTGQNGVVIFDPVTSGLDPDGDNVFHFTTITIPPGVTLRMRGLELQFAPVYWLASGAVQIDGAVDLSGEDGHDDVMGNRRPSMPGPGGFPGGVGPTADSPAQPGLGPGGGLIKHGGSHATSVPNISCSFDVARPPYGNLFLIPLTGGSGGGGSNTNFGGGAGGGALLIASTESIRVDGAIRADGGNTTEFCGGRGSGPGGRFGSYLSARCLIERERRGGGGSATVDQAARAADRDRRCRRRRGPSGTGGRARPAEQVRPVR